MDVGSVKFPQFRLNDKQKSGLLLLNNPEFRWIKFKGGSRSGKTVILCIWIILRCLRYPGSAHLIARQTRTSAKSSIWEQTLLNMLRPLISAGICRIQESELTIKFPGGSYVRVDGLEAARIDKILGTEWATIWINECNETPWKTISLLRSRLNSTAIRDDGRRIQTKFLADLNPTTKSSWHYKLFERKIDPISDEPIKNPEQYTTLWFHPSDNSANLEEGYIQSLESGDRHFRQRFLYGEYGSFEGLVYNLDEVHILDSWQPPHWSDPKRHLRWRFGRAVDFGFWPDPFCCLWGALDTQAGAIYIYREWYAHKILVRDHAHIITKMSAVDAGDSEVEKDVDRFYQGVKSGEWEHINRLYEFSACDHDREDRETLHAAGIQTIPADKRRIIGIEHVADLLDFNDHKKPRLYITRNCVNTITEFESYCWKEPRNGALVKDRETAPGSDHAMDALRYLCMSFIPPRQQDFNVVLGRPW